MSSLARLYVTADLKEGEGIVLGDSQGHYLARVMRLGGGDRARVFNGRDGEWEAELAISGRKVEAVPIVRRRNQPDLNVAGPELLFAPLKKTRTDFAVEKATELGVADIRPVMTERTQTGRVNTERLVALATEAAEQTERMDLPGVHEMVSLACALDDWDPARPLVFCDEGNEPGSASAPAVPPMAEALSGLARGTSGGVLVGPEGGFSEAERADLRARPFVTAVTLGPRILRAETAVVAALTIWQAVLGDWH